jgi:hypothetical protein
MATKQFYYSTTVIVYQKGVTTRSWLLTVMNDKCSLIDHKPSNQLTPWIRLAENSFHIFYEIVHDFEQITEVLFIVQLYILVSNKSKGTILNNATVLWIF